MSQNISNLKDLCNFKFFSENGTEIYAEKQYVITWKLITDNKSLYQVPEGFILGDIELVKYKSRKNPDEILYEYYRLRPDTLTIGFTKYPKVIISPKNKYNPTDGIDPNDKESVNRKIYNSLFLNNKGQLTQVEITVKLNNSDYKLTVDANLFFDQTSYTYNNDQRISIGYNDSEDDYYNDYTLIYTITDIDLFTVKDIFKRDENGDIIYDENNKPILTAQYGTWDEITPESNYTEFSELRTPKPYIYYLLEPDERGILIPKSTEELTKSEYWQNGAYVDPYETRKITSKIQGIAQLFPFIHYNASIIQEKTSTGFIAANTLIMLEQCVDINGDVYYERPALKGDNGWVLSLECSEEGELKFIEVNANNEINQVTTKHYRLNYLDYENVKNLNPITAAIGVASDTEGCYQNYIGLYIRHQNDMDTPFFMGAITVKTEIIGEDERYRTLLENFGIPDPIKYTKVFYDSEYNESLPDYQLVNEKSKELMLTYDQIFPYAGTYKALINALQFLGYTDIIIKEWYKFFDSNDRERDVAFDSVDIRKNKVAELLYKTYNINVNNRNTRLSKLNWLSLVYHINEIINIDKLEEVDAYVVDTKLNQIINEKKLYFDVPQTQPIYAYRTEEITAKLHYLKKWLEAYIVGVNARIIEITGEGVYYAPMKTSIYNTGILRQDFLLSAHATPKVLNVSDFIESNADITCTLAELSNISFKDMDDKTFDFFTQDTLSFKFNNITIPYNISNTLETPVFGDEYQFDLKVRPTSGIIYQPRTLPKTNAVIVNNNNLDFLNNSCDEIIFQEPLPIISLEIGNIRNLTGTWERNVEWMIQEQVDADTYETIYYLKNIGTYEDQPDEIFHNTHIRLIPIKDKASMKFTVNNKWRAPMLLIKGYKFDIDFNKYFVHPEYFNLDNDKEYILEIVQGKLLFSGKTDEIGYDKLEEFSTEILFAPNLFDTKQLWHQGINIQYTYTTERSPFKTFNIKKFKEAVNAIEIPTSLNYEITDSLIQMQALSMFNNQILNDNYINDYLNNPDVIAYTKKILEDRKEANIKNYIYGEIKEIYNNLYKSYKEITTTVHHLGDYDITVKMFDRYNNIYTNQKKAVASISANPIGFNIYMNQEYSNNASDFTNRNAYGDTLLYQENQKNIPLKIKNEILSDLNTIKYPNNYDLYDIQYLQNGRDYLSYYNYTYAMDVPQSGNTLILSNHSIQIKDLICKNSIASIKLFDFSDKNQRLLMLDEKVMICVYDKINLINKEILGPYTIIKSEKVTAYDYEGSIDIQLKENENIVYNKDYTYYLINTTEYEITLDNIIKINDTFNGFILSNEVGKCHYMINDVIKINYYCNTKSYHIKEFFYEPGPNVFYNALYDPLYPVLSIRYKTHPENNIDIQYHKGTDNKDYTVSNIADIESMLLFEFEYIDEDKENIISSNYYREGKWYVTDILEHQLNSSHPAVISFKETIEPIFNSEYQTLNKVQRTSDIEFSDTNTSGIARFGDEDITDTLYNSVSYRVANIIENKKFVKDIGYLPEYTYILDAPIDVWFMQKYGNKNIYDLTVKVMYPYSEQVHYHAQIIEDANESMEEFGAYNYSLIKTSFIYDVDNMFLDNYIDNNFIGRIYKFDPNDLKNIKVDTSNKDSILFKDNITIYNYYEMPVTIPEGRTIMIAPHIDNQYNKFDSLLTYTWEWKYRVYTDLDNIEYQIENPYASDTLFICQNKALCLKPNTYGPNDIILSVTDKFGNILVNNSTGRIYITK